MSHLDDRADRQQRYFDDHLSKARVLTILRGFDPAETVRLCEAASGMGIVLIEVPVQDDDAFASLEAAARWGKDSNVRIGAGTVTTVDRLTRAVETGAEFTVAPGFDTEVAAESLRLGVPHLPGVATGTEVQRALAAGFVWQKAFPASVLGAGWIAAMAGPFPTVKFVVTGGIDVSNARSFLDAGARAVALGSNFATADPVAVATLM